MKIAVVLSIFSIIQAKPTGDSLVCKDNQNLVDGECQDVENACGSNGDAEYCTSYINEEKHEGYNLLGQCRTGLTGDVQCICPSGMMKDNRPRFSDTPESERPCIEPLTDWTKDLKCTLEDKNYEVTCDLEAKSMKPCTCKFIGMCVNGSKKCNENQVCEHSEGSDPICRCLSSHNFFDENGLCSDVDPCSQANCNSSENCIVEEQKTAKCVSKCENCNGEGQECAQNSVGNEHNYECRCKEGFTGDEDGNCVKVEEPEITPDQEEVVPAEPEVTDKPVEEGDNEISEGDNVEDVDGSTEKVEAAGTQQTLFIVGVAVIIVVSIGILLWLKQRKEAGTEEENRDLNR